MTPAMAFGGRDRYRCPKGHEQSNAFYFYVDGAEGKTWRSAPICHRCMSEWVAATFPTTKLEPDGGSQR